jgi:hypothetical protein
MTQPEKASAYPHYYRPVSGLTHVDVYRVLDLFGVKRSAVAHAVKKLLCSGQRGGKSELEDLIEARNSIERAIEMIGEEER